MNILLSHHRASSFEGFCWVWVLFVLVVFFFLETWCFRTLLLVLLLSSPAGKARTDDSEIAKNITQRCHNQETGLKIMRFLPNRNRFFSLVLWCFCLRGHSSVLSSDECVMLFSLGLNGK